MDAQALLDQLLQSGKKLAEQGLAHSAEFATKSKSMAEQGVEFAKKKLELPPAGPERDKMLTNLGVGAAAGGLLALLVGTRTGRRALGPALKLGSLAALGGLGYKVYTDWQNTQGIQPPADAVASLAGPITNERCLMIVRAMIAAAKADGNVDSRERGVIEARIKSSNLDPTTTEILIDEIQKPLDVSSVAATATTPANAVEVYLASLLVTDEASALERQYLADLAVALKLEPQLVQRLEAEAFAVG